MGYAAVPLKLEHATTSWQTAVMISVVIPTLNAEPTLTRTLSALVPAAVDGLVRQVIVVDGGSHDKTLEIADVAGADIVESNSGRGAQLVCGAKEARFPWLLFLHADTVLSSGWEDEAEYFISEVDSGKIAPKGASFRFRLDDRGIWPRCLESMVAFRSAALATPYGDQGLLIPRQLFDEIGGYRGLPIMEDVDIVRRLGRRRLYRLRADAVTSAERYRRDGYTRRVLRNQVCLALYNFGVPPARIEQLYSRAKS